MAQTRCPKAGVKSESMQASLEYIALDITTSFTNTELCASRLDLHGSSVPTCPLA